MTQISTISLQTKPCPECGETGFIRVSVKAATQYENGASIQDAFSMLSSDDRERLTSGLHGECWSQTVARFDEELNGEDE